MLLKSSPKNLFILFIACCLLYGCNSSLEQASLLYKKTAKHYEQLLEKNPQNLNLRLKLARFYYDFKDYQKAKALTKGMSNLQIKVLFAKVLARLKDYDYAIEVFQQLKLKPQDSKYLYLYGQVLEEKNLFPKALGVYNKVTAPYAQEARKRIQLIKAVIEEGIPPEVSGVFKEAEGFIAQVKDEAAILLFVDEEIEITSKNTSISTIHVIEKVLKERGKDLAEVEVGYDSTYERVELEMARTITKQGKIIYAGKENVRDIGRYRNFPLYSNSRAFIVSMPSVDVGSFIEYKVKIYSSKLVDEDNFNFIYRLREKYPVFKAEFRLIVPKGRKAHFKFFNQKYAQNFNLKPSRAENKDKEIYIWKFKEIKPIIPEYAIPPGGLINPAVLISSFSSWDQIYKWWQALYKDKIKINKEIKDFVKALTKDTPDKLDKAKVIYEYVAKNIRYVAIEYGDSGHEPHSADEVFINRYGDCKDQAILLVAMLKEAGLSAYPVLIPTRSVYSIDKDFPSINFNHAICALKADDKLIFMDPTSETTPFMNLPLSDQDRLVMVFLDNSFSLINTGQIKDNKVIYAMDIVINDQESAVITRSVETKGFFAAGYRWYLKYTHPAIIKEDIQKKMTQIASLSQLINYEIKNADNFDANPSLRYKFKARKFLNPAGNLRIIPVLDQISPDYNLIGKEERNYPLDFDGFYTKVGKIKISLPDNLKLKYLPGSRILENPWFKLEVSYQDKSGYINFYQEFTIKKRFVERENYQEFKKHLEEAIYLLREEILLEKQE